MLPTYHTPQRVPDLVVLEVSHTVMHGPTLTATGAGGGDGVGGDEIVHVIGSVVLPLTPQVRGDPS